jgi:hypothetical protein
MLSASAVPPSAAVVPLPGADQHADAQQQR